MEADLLYEIQKSISELKGRVFPTNAPKGTTKPCLVYYKAGDTKLLTLDGPTDSGATRYFFSIMAQRYEEMKTLVSKAEALLHSLPLSKIGPSQTYVQDLVVEDITELYEERLALERGIIDFTIYY